jgi:hypothetical protein
VVEALLSNQPRDSLRQHLDREWLWKHCRGAELIRLSQRKLSAPGIVLDDQDLSYAAQAADLHRGAILMNVELRLARRFVSPANT